MKDVRFDSLNYSSADAGWPMLTLSGTTKSYGRLATKFRLWKNIIKSNRFPCSGLSSDTTGLVKFNLKITL